MVGEVLPANRFVCSMDFNSELASLLASSSNIQRSRDPWTRKWLVSKVKTFCVLFRIGSAAIPKHGSSFLELMLMTGTKVMKCVEWEMPMGLFQTGRIISETRECDLGW